MLIADLAALMQTIAPIAYAEPWDKVGLLAGDAQRELQGPVLLTIDLNEAVLDEAVRLGCGAIIAYHPPIFEPLTKVTSATPRQRVILRALEARIALYSPHTGLDAIAGGVTDWLCEGLSGSMQQSRIAGDCRALSAHASVPSTQQMKIVTFAQAKDVELLRNTLASAGAGQIGEYQLCSFTTTGEGTFLGSDKANPTVGQKGIVEHVPEVRLEMVCSKSALPVALEMLRKFHPYEEPPIDIYELVPQPRRAVGSGRKLTLDKPATVRELAERLKAFTGAKTVRFALAGDNDKPIRIVGVVPGSGESLSKLARSEGCEVFVTGEMKHHEVLGALNAGMHVILGGHTSTERGYLPRLKAKMEEQATKRGLTGLRVIQSVVDKTPLETL
jgi:dinuclear metal center YbgI/SA1388 family protein